MGKRTWHCGFCGCSQDEAAHMVRAQAVAICGMCIVDAAATLAGQWRTGEATRQLVEAVSRATERAEAQGRQRPNKSDIEAPASVERAA